MENINEDIGANVKHLREAKGITQSKLAEKAGVSQQAIDRIEKARFNTSLMLTQRVLSALDMRLTISKINKMNMEKEIIEGGYLTHALTDAKRRIYGVEKNYYIADHNMVSDHWYWSEVYRYGNMTMIVRRGPLLVDITQQEFEEKLEQSKINLAE